MRPVDLVGGAAVELEVARQRPGVGARLGQRLADVARLEERQPLDLVLDEPPEAREQPPPLGRRQRAPFAGERGLGGRHGGVDVGGAAAGDAADLLAGRGVLDRQRLAARGRHPRAADQAEAGRRRRRRGQAFVRCRASGPSLSRRGAAATSARVYSWRGASRTVARRPLLDDPAGAHHHDTVGDRAHHRQVVGDEEVGEAEAAGAGRRAGRAPAPGPRRRAPRPPRRARSGRGG